MSAEINFGDYTRFARRPDVENALLEIGDTTVEFAHSLADISKDYDSTVAFSYAPGSDIALPLATTPSPNAAWNRNSFRKDTLMGRRLLLRNTTLGDVLANPYYAGLSVSLINHEEPQAVYTEVLWHENRIVGALQHSFTPTEPLDYLANVPSNDQIERLTNTHYTEIAAVAANIALLQVMGAEHGSLGAALEFEDPIAPNSYIIRWDVEGSQSVPAGYGRQALNAYLDTAHRFAREATTVASGGHYDDQGDGSYIVLPLPAYINPYKPDQLSQYEESVADTLVDELRGGLAVIGDQFLPEIMPQVQVSGMFGYAEKNSLGRLTSNAMYTLAKQKAK